MLSFFKDQVTPILRYERIRKFGEIVEGVEAVEIAILPV